MGVFALVGDPKLGFPWFSWFLFGVLPAVTLRQRGAFCFSAFLLRLFSVGVFVRLSDACFFGLPLRKKLSFSPLFEWRVCAESQMYPGTERFGALRVVKTAPSEVCVCARSPRCTLGPTTAGGQRPSSKRWPPKLCLMVDARMDHPCVAAHEPKL